jgi:arylformamidase
MAVYDVTRKVCDGLMAYPGDPVAEIYSQSVDRCMVSEIKMCSHSGTHIDAPRHYLPEGCSVDMIDPFRLIGPVVVVDSGVKCGEIAAECFLSELRNENCKRLLIKTGFSYEDKFREDYPYLSEGAARMIADAGLLSFGIDTPSVDPYGGDGQNHRIILSENIPIIELADLSDVKSGSYFMYALPLRLSGLDGSPARVILTDPEDELL